MATDDGGSLAFVVGLSVMSIVFVIIVVLVLVSVVAYFIFKRWSKSKKAEYGKFFSLDIGMFIHCVAIIIIRHSFTR